MSEERWQLPKTWAWAEAGQIAEIIGGATPSTKDPSNFSDDGVPWVTPADLTGFKDVYISRGKRDLSQKGYESSSARLMPTGTVLFSSRAPIGYCAIAANPISTNQGFKSLVLPRDIQPEFIRYYLISSVDYAEEQASGTTFKELSGSRMSGISIPLAPSNEQRRIVSKIDSLFVKTRRAREELDEFPHLIQRYKKAILTTAFRGELTVDWRAENPELEPVENLVARTPQPNQTRGGREATKTVIEGRAAISVNRPTWLLPENWSWVSLRQIARQETGHTPSRKHPEYWDGNVPWIGIRDAANHHGGVIMDTSQHVTEKGLENSSARMLPTDTVCLSRTASVGYVVMMGRSMATSQDFVTWTCTDALDPKYLMYALLAEGDDIRRFGKGSTHTTIYFPEVRAFHITLAPIEEQREIVRQVEEALTWIDKIEQEHEATIRLLDHLDQSILRRAYRGELVSQDPNDEPAIKLLQRIREERARLKKDKPARRRQRRTGGETLMVEKKPSRRPVVEVISELSAPISPERLFQLSGFSPEDVDVFYAEIKQAVMAGQMEQDSEKNLGPVR